MQIDIQHIAKLSRLSIEKEKVEKFQKEMENIVAMCEKLPPMDAVQCARIFAEEGAVCLAVSCLTEAMQLRQDEIRPSLKRDQLLQNAPQTQAGCVVVPKVVE